jgi:DNA-binding response OmpR family regulator
MSETMSRRQVLVVGMEEEERKRLFHRLAAVGIDVMIAADGNEGAGLMLLKKPGVVVVANTVGPSDLELMLWAAEANAKTSSIPVLAIGEALGEISRQMNGAGQDQQRVVYFKDPMDIEELVSLISPMV